VTLKGNDPGKALDSMREAIFPKIPLAELGVTDDLKNREEAEKQVFDGVMKFRARKNRVHRTIL